MGGVMAKKKLNIGMVGYGFMGRAHSNAFSQVPHFFDLPYQPVLKAVCARNEDKVQAFADQWGYESIEDRLAQAHRRKEIDLIDIASPNDTHMEIAIAAAEAGKMVMCEKPLGRTAAERENGGAVEKAGVANMVWYNYRRVPAVTLAKQLIDEGKLGKIFHYRAKFLQDWTISKDLPQGGQGLWRLDVDVAGQACHRRSAGALHRYGDSGSTVESTEVTGMTETFIKERQHNLTGKKEKVGIDDASLFLARFDNGSLANFEATRYARGHKALYTLEINGENASIVWDLHDLHRLQYFDHRDEGRDPRLALDPRHRRRPSLHEQVVGAWSADRL